MSAVPRVVGLVQPFEVGRAFFEPADLARPAAAADLTYTVSGKYWERLLSLVVDLVTDGNAANRAVFLQVLDQDSTVRATVPPAAVQTATLTRTYSYLYGQASVLGPINGVYLAPMPPLFLLPGWKMRLHVDAMQVTDRFSVPHLLRERFPTGPEGYGMGAYVVPESPGGVAEAV